MVWYVVVYVLCFSGMRPSPVLRVNSEDVESPVLNTPPPPPPSSVSAYTTATMVAAPPDDTNFSII